MTNGEELFSDPGSGGDYYKNLEFVVYNINSIAHNVMLIDYDPESQAPADYDNGIASLKEWPLITHSFAGEIADAIESDLACVYKNKLETYTRTLLYTKHGPLFLFDNVKSSSGGHMYNWVFHAPQNENRSRSISYSSTNQRLTIDRPGARLTMDVVSPKIAEGVVRNSNFGENYSILTSSPDTEETDFLAVILPEGKPENGEYGSRPSTKRIQKDGWIGARVERNNAVDIGLFRNKSNASSEIEGFTTDALRFTVSFDSKGKLMKTYFEGSGLAGHGVSIRSKSPVTCAVIFYDSGANLEVQSENKNTVNIIIPTKPSQIILNGNVLKNWKYDPGSETVSIDVTAGRSNISINRIKINPNTIF
jgi:hypothetical protein